MFTDPYFLVGVGLGFFLNVLDGAVGSVADIVKGFVGGLGIDPKVLIYGAGAVAAWKLDGIPAPYGNAVIGFLVGSAIRCSGVLASVLSGFGSSSSSAAAATANA